MNMTVGRKFPRTLKRVIVMLAPCLRVWLTPAVFGPLELIVWQLILCTCVTTVVGPTDLIVQLIIIVSRHTMGRSLE